MKIGIISDIHGYIEPLNRAIALFEEHDVSQIICVGDLVDGGWDGDAVIDSIRSRNITTVRGNHDREAFQEQTDYDFFEDHNTINFDHQINLYRAEYVRSLQMVQSFRWEDITISLAHATPWNDTLHIFPNTSPEVCRKLFDTMPSDIMILGHTHIPMKLKYQHHWIFNAGALCGNRHDLLRTCAILTLPQIEFVLFDIDTRQEIDLETRVIE